MAAFLYQEPMKGRRSVACKNMLRAAKVVESEHGGSRKVAILSPWNWKLLSSPKECPWCRRLRWKMHSLPLSKSNNKQKNIKGVPGTGFSLHSMNHVSMMKHKKLQCVQIWLCAMVHSARLRNSSGCFWSVCHPILAKFISKHLAIVTKADQIIVRTFMNHSVIVIELKCLWRYNQACFFFHVVFVFILCWCSRSKSEQCETAGNLSGDVCSGTQPSLANTPSGCCNKKSWIG